MEISVSITETGKVKSHSQRRGAKIGYINEKKETKTRT